MGYVGRYLVVLSSWSVVCRIGEGGVERDEVENKL